MRAAELAADKGGGVKARVLLGDAHFRLAHYKEAAKAYEDALKIDPAQRQRQERPGARDQAHVPAAAASRRGSRR